RPLPPRPDPPASRPLPPLLPSPHPRVPHLQESPAMSTRPIGAAVRQRAARFGIAAAALTLGLTALPGLVPMAQAAVVEPGDLQIQEIYGGGGNAGAVFQNDFDELVNTSEDDLSVDGWTLQYASTSGTFNNTLTLEGIVGAGEVFLIQLAA